MRTTFIILLLTVFSTRALPLYEDSHISESLELDAILLAPSPSPEPYDDYLDNSNMNLSFFFRNLIVEKELEFLSRWFSRADNLFIKYYGQYEN